MQLVILKSVIIPNVRNIVNCQVELAVDFLGGNYRYYTCLDFIVLHKAYDTVQNF